MCWYGESPRNHIRNVHPRIDSPTFTTMESKKLQQLQQANSHLAPIPQTKPPTFQQHGNDFRSNRSPVFQNHPQYQSFASNFAQINYSHQIRPQQPQQLQSQQQQSPQQQQQQHLSAHSSPKSNSNSLYLSEYSSSSHVGQPQHHHTIGSHYHFDQIYQTSSPSSGSGERDRLYQTAPRPTQHTHSNPQPLSKLELQFQQLQREKIQAQIKTATEALAHQQQTFALRQQLNPPVPNYHLKQNLLQNLSQQHQQQIQHQQQQLQLHQNRNAPPSSLNLTSHFQPAQGPMKLINQNMHDYGATATNQHPMNETLYQAAGQQKQHFHPKTPNNLQSPAPNQIIIQQNIPGHVVNQACQTQISGVKNQTQNQKSPNSDSLSSPSHDGLERRKSGPVHTLKSPVTKRPANAPISMSGWLYKQGSDGLKVWRRRWFVLSEYILYYYKSQEEEKLLGTVLLPSYKISACFPEDKVYRKFAFKCEHTNMRTFVFAAETAESMTAWVRSLTLATMMQGSSGSEASPPSNNARSGDNSDSGIQTYQSQQAGKTGIVQAPVTPVSDNGGGGGSQPLYANAPPKPRRANDGGYSSPSPEHLPERYDQEPHQSIYGSRDINQPKQPTDAMNNPNLMQTQSPLIKRGFNDQITYDPNYNDAIYGNAKRIERDLYIQKLIQQQQQQQQQLHQLQQQQKQQQQLAMQQTPPQHHQQQQQPQQQQHQHQQQQLQQQRQYTNPFMHPNADRRTPDTYGPPRAAMDKHMSDYEDIYNLTVLSKSLPPHMTDEAAAASGYRRPMSPLRYEAQNSAMPLRYTPNYLENSPAQQQHVQMRARPVQSTIPRPHSADFLDYEARNPIKAKLKEEPARAPRPKSSLDINRTPDNYYYSEASYAEKMRMQSVSYLQRTNLTGLSNKLRSDEPHGVNNAGTVPRDGYYGMRSDYGDELQQGSASVPRTQRMTMNNLKKYPSQQEQFLRSASARLPRKEEDPTARDGERKREESMKRLLEWKQRMLQSPLTRKISQQQQHQLSGSPSSTGGNPFLTKPVNISLEAEAYLHSQNQPPMPSQPTGDNKANLEYNSYSSDDEDGTEITPAGRSSPNVSASAGAVLETSEIVPEAEVPIQNPKELLLGGDMVDNSQTFSSSVNDDSNIYENNSIAAASGSKPIKLLASGNFKERLLPLEPESKYVPVYDHSAIIKSPISQSLKSTDDTDDKTDTTISGTDISAIIDDENDEQSFEYTDQDLDEALQAELGEDPPPSNESDDLHLVDITSENQSFYMPMAPKKPVLNVDTSELKVTAMDILNSIQKCTTDKNIPDENTYIEMTNGMGGKCVFGDDLKSTYEMIVVQSSGSSKADQEPLYMELSQLTSNSLEKRNKSEKNQATESATSTLKKKQTERGTLTRKHSKSKRNDLPDILKSNNSYLKSDDSSDADDESPKDSDQTRIKVARSRFSLSDTFRPASYYLGASTSTPLGECVDSSDSEIVSPPPIPTAALPLDEHNSDEIFLSENFDTVKRRDKGSKSNSRSSLLNSSDHRQPSQTSLSGSIESKSLSGKHPYGSNRSSLQSNHLYVGYNAERFDNGSNTSSDYDLYRRLKPDPADDASRRTSTSLSETESVELRRSSSKMDIHTRNKRRPISEDSLNEIQMLGTFGIDESLSNANFDQYLGNLESVYVNSKESTPRRMVWLDNSLTNLSIGEASFKNGHDNSIYYENVEIQARAGSNSGNRTDDDRKVFYDSLEDVASHEKVTLSPLKEKNLSIHDARCESEDLMAAGRSNLNIEIVDSVTTMSSMDLDQRSSCTVFDLTQTTTPAHSRGNSNLSDSAPYYYSDLQSRDSSVSDITKLTDLSRIKFPPKLNNQRDIGVKKAGISHIHNPINHVKAANILTAAEKDHEIDQRNIYESDRMIDKNVNKMLEVSLSSNSKNYYSNKMMNNKPIQLEEQPVMPSTSMLASILKSSNSASSSQVLAAISNQAASSKSSLNISTEMSASGDQLWEEDSLWRDNLRRASHMHAKSMESLDHLGSASSMQSKLSTLNRKHARQAGKAITRDVTYVNDDLLTKTQLLKKQHKSQSSSDDNDVYVQLANNMNRTDSTSSDTTSDVYEVLRDETKYDIDRENIRQWDLMSSGLVNSTNKTLEADDRESHRIQTVKERSSSRESTLKRKKGGSLGLDGPLPSAKGTPKTGTLVGTGSSIDPTSPATVDSNDYTPSPGSSHVFATSSPSSSSSDAHVHKKHSNTTTHSSISVRNVKNMNKMPLTVKPDPSDYRVNPQQMHGYYDASQTEYYYQAEQERYIRPDISFESTHDLYTQAQLQRAQEMNLQQHYQLQDIDRSLAAMSHESPEEKWPAANQHLFAGRGPQTPSQDKTELRTLEMSAGDLLNRTHEELVLLLIQLRRQNSNTARSIEQCCTNIHDIQNSIRISDGPTRAENLARLEALKKQLTELEKQYEKEKPLINLVDNMVKLGTLYRGAPGKKKVHSSESATLDRLEFNQRVQERRLLQEEQRQWDRLSPNHVELQSKVQQLYQIDRLLQEESGTLQSLQRDKEDLERALGGLKARIMNADAPAVAVEAARQQQHTLERELSRVHLMLAENSKKLEKTVADNARLEQELLVLRQKLQASRDTRGSQGTLAAGQDGQYVGTATAVLESELRRVQRLVGDMQRQRQELSQAVRQLTDNSDNLYSQINKNGDNRSHIKKRSHSTSWVETDLDSLVSKDHGRNESNSSLNLSDKPSSMSSRNDHERSESFESYSVDSDDLLEDSVGGPFGFQDKQEIKTVRIVKRESERRHRDREKDRGNVSTHSLDQVLEEEAQIFEDYTNYHRSKSLPRGYETHEAFVQNQDAQTYANNLKDYYSVTANGNNSYPVSMIDRKADLYSGCDRQVKPPTLKAGNFQSNSSLEPGTQMSGLRNKTESVQSLTISEQSPVFQSEAAKQIIHEMVGNGTEKSQPAASNGEQRPKQKPEHLAQQNKHRRSVPKEKRRHHTAPHHVTAKQIEIMQSENDMNKNNINWRARDDVDLEVTLRPRSNAPDVVRSAMGPREKISEHTIDKLLAAPSKILIPERYVPEQAPELSPEEKRRRQEKVEAIKKMLSETPIAGNDTSPNQPANAEKRQREHLLQLNQILAQQVMQMSKIVAGITHNNQTNQIFSTLAQFNTETMYQQQTSAQTKKDDNPMDQNTENSMAVLPSSISKLKKTRGLLRGRKTSGSTEQEDEDANYRSEVEDDDDTESPPEPLPLYQQRENYFT
ncbi:uncharacterized protein LOC128733725 [Sabethes cyaneus]|uniref:uncharacterized protein LOC128733725 n=1 Tax=Sabethes cyaneus TaxID=53552 RepID=UPI00237DC8FE|nr:uncharacterized protein LOC128733725 [Sabethes cyaneus]